MDVGHVARVQDAVREFDDPETQGVAFGGRIEHQQALVYQRLQDVEAGAGIDAERLCDMRDTGRFVAMVDEPQDLHGVHERRAELLGHSPCGTLRSEEHTSELQSLMRISYAVFCL